MKKERNITNTNSDVSIKKNAVFNIIYQLVQIIVPILLIPILSGRLQTNGTGSYAFIHSIVLYFSYFALLGVNYYGTKTIASKKNHGEEVGKHYFWIIFYAKAITSIIAIGGYLTFCFIYNQNQFVLFTQLLFLIGNFLDVSWFFMGDENFKSLCIRNIIVKTVSFTLIVIFVRTQADIGIYSLILGSAEVFNQVFMWFLLLRKRIFNPRPKVSFKEIAVVLKGMAIYFVPVLLIELYTILNTTILGIMWGGSESGYGEVGIFDYANKIVSVITTIAVSLGMVFLARVSSLNEQNKKDEIIKRICSSMFYSLYISLPLVIGIIGTGHSIIKWFLDGSEWNAVGVLLFFFPIKALFISISNTLGVQYLISTGRMKHYIISIAVGSVTCVILNLILIKPYGAIGATISILVAEFLVALTQCIIVKKEINVLKVIGSLWKVFVSCAVMSVFVAISYLFFYNNICLFYANLTRGGKTVLVLADLTIILCAAIIYFATLTLLKDNTMMTIINKLKINTKSRRIILSCSCFMLVFCVVCSTAFYTPYKITFSNNFMIRKRNIAIDIANNTRQMNKADDYTNRDIPFIAIKDNEYESVISSFNKQKNKGFILNYQTNTNKINMITYNFSFSYCLERGQSFPISLKYCIQQNNYIMSNIDKMYICVDLLNIGDPDSSKLIYITNKDNCLTNYFNNPRRDFISYMDSTSIWKKDNFGFFNESNKDHGYCTISVFFVDNNTPEIAPSLEDFNLKQEAWFLEK